nr:hypothetical protein [uncultured Prevotella sp.]
MYKPFVMSVQAVCNRLTKLCQHHSLPTRTFRYVNDCWLTADG